MIQVYNKPAHVSGGAERVASAIHDITGAKVYAIQNWVDGDEYVHLGDESEVGVLRERYYEQPAGVTRLRDRLRSASMLSEKAVVDEAESVLFHNAPAAQLTEESDFRRSVFYNHRCVRELTFLFDFYDSAKFGIESHALRQMRDEMLGIYRDLYHLPDVVVSNSHFISQKTEEYFNIETEVIYPPVDRTLFKPTDGASGDFYVSVQRMDATKRLEDQLLAFAGTDEELVIVGDGRFDEYVRREAEKMDNVTYVGRVTDRELVSYLNRAKAHIQTATMEDFGLTAVEAMACGTPNIVPDEGGYRETVVPPAGERYAGGPERLRDVVESFDPAAYDQDVIRGESERYGMDRFADEIGEVVG